MKNAIRTAIAAVAFSATAFAYAAPTEISRSQAQDLEQIGVVSYNGSSNISDVTEQLSRKAAEAGATHFRITSAGGDNRINGTAAIYR